MPLAHASGLRASLTAPSQAPYVAPSLGVAGQSVSIRLLAAGPGVVDIGRVRVAYTATREGVSFPCAQPVTTAREPASLEAGQAFSFERDLDCSMPLPGRYEVGVRLALQGAEPTGPAADLLGTFTLDVVARGSVPKPYPSRPGLYALMVGDRMTRPLPAEAWNRGDYHVVVALVNAGPAAVPLGPGQLTFSTYKVGSPLPCSGQAEVLALPEQLAPGVVQTVQVPVACAPSAEGRYDIVGRLSLGTDGPTIEVGRVPLTVTGDPIRFAPAPEYPWSRDPTSELPH